MSPRHGVGWLSYYFLSLRRRSNLRVLIKIASPEILRRNDKKYLEISYPRTTCTIAVGV
jgi:hypothetical protein